MSGDRALDGLIATLEAQCAESTTRVAERHGDEIERNRHDVAAGVGEALDRLRERIREISGDDPLCVDLAAMLTDYVEWLQWTFWDLPTFAVVTSVEGENLRRNVAACGFVYLSLRLLDDVLDGHYRYRQRRPTLLARLSDSHGAGRRAEGLTVLSALLLCLEGVAELDRMPDGPRLGQVVDSARRAVIGAMLEHAPAERWDDAYYQRLIALKNVDYWRCLYVAIDPDCASPLYPFLTDYYAVAQKLNDLQDVAADEARDQPNLVGIVRRQGDDASDRVAAILADDCRRLAELAAGLPENERDIAYAKLGEHLAEAKRLKVFEPVEAESSTADSSSDSLSSLDAMSSLADFVEACGVEALVEVEGCPVCGSGERRLLLRQRGFALHRCAGCSHVFVSPRLQDTITARLAREHDDEGDDEFLASQRMWSGFVCRLLGDHAPGPRLVDLGFGDGSLMRMARGLGFDVYGVEASARRRDRMRVYFGDRITMPPGGDEPLPWGQFDAVVASHLLEHLPDPGAFLSRIHDALVDGGIVYVAVPDIASLQFRVLGKRWPAINPVAHIQYFDHDSLERLLTDRGFEIIERVEPPALVGHAPRWMRLFRKLGGTESGELAILARRPEAEKEEDRDESPPKKHDPTQRDPDGRLSLPPELRP
ncbi:MAG: class I SAM-dependent methyltransferase [Acidobacteriota bacterium]